MTLTITPTGAICGAFISGIDLTQEISPDLAAELRAHWLAHKVLAFPDQKMSNADLERFTLSFGAFGDDPFFGHIEGHTHIAAIARKADEKAPVFAESFHSDWSFMEIPPAGTCLFGITIPPQGGDTLFADQTAAYARLPDALREKADSLIAVHSAELAYAPDGFYGDNENENDRSMEILFDESAREKRQHPFVRTHPETGQKALFSSPAYIQSFVGLAAEESTALLHEFYAHQSAEDIIYRHKWQKDMLVIWDNRSLLHAATGGYDGYDRLLHRTTVADTRF